MSECGRADVAERETRPRGGSESPQGGQPKARDETPAVVVLAIERHGVAGVRGPSALRAQDEVAHIVRSA